jgi:integrase
MASAGTAELPKGFKKKTKRERLVSDKELASVISELIKPLTGKQTHAHYFHRARLAHILEFGYWTGLRRKEIARLKFAQYDNEQQALLNVKRWKTDTVTKFFPLGKRAIEIINERRKLQKDSDYIFTPSGQPIESNYRTLKNICEDLKIPYGRFTDGGFVSHDLRHNFGTEILRGSDIETARELLGHSNISQTSTYVHTSAERLRDAVRKRDKIDYDAELKRYLKRSEKIKSNSPNLTRKSSNYSDSETQTVKKWSSSFFQTYKHNSFNCLPSVFVSRRLHQILFCLTF